MFNLMAASIRARPPQTAKDFLKITGAEDISSGEAEGDGSSEAPTTDVTEEATTRF